MGEKILLNGITLLRQGHVDRRHAIDEISHIIAMVHNDGVRMKAVKCRKRVNHTCWPVDGAGMSHGVFGRERARADERTSGGDRIYENVWLRGHRIA